MPKTLARLLSAAVCLLPNLLFAAAQPAPPPAATSEQASDSYIVQAGDTLVGIARRLGLSPQALAKANALERPDKIIVGNVLRLPVTPPADTASAPAAPSAAATQPEAPTQPALQRPLQPPSQAKEPDKPTPASAAAKTDPEPAAKAMPPKGAAAPPATPQTASVQTPAESPAKAVDTPGDVARLAVGSYANPTLGTLRIAQAPAGIAVTRDNRTIPMRHLLYSVFDGVDTNGEIHSLRLQYDDAGQVRAVLYSSSSSKDIPFARVNK